MFKRFLTSISRTTPKAVSRAFIGLSGLCLSALLPIAAYAQDYSVEINKTKILQLQAPAAAVIVGNPAIADVSVHSPTMLFIVGRGYGVTNVIILDEFGQTIMDADIQVGQNKSSSGKRVLLAGQGWKSYDCNPFCQPAPVLGDDPMFVAQFRGQGQAIDNTNTPISPTAFSGQRATQSATSSAQPGFSVPNTFTPQTFVPELQQLGPPARSNIRGNFREY